jgi:peptide/nickel transport system substrate-binding protein
MSEQQSKLTKACSLARAGRISRRDFHQLAIASGLTLATADALFLSEAKAQPKKGGAFRVGVGSGATTDTLDPATWPDTFNGLFGWGTLGASLTEVEPDGKVIGDAAESFEASEDAKAWVFRLRKGAEFHDGKSLTADDVVASINHHRGAESKSAAKSLLKPVVDVKADGKDVVVVTLDSGNADFPYIASDYHLPILPSKDGKANWQDGIGLGPYKKTAFDPGVRGAATRFENFYKPANFDEVEILTIIDVAARTNALTSGDVNFIDRVDLKTVAQLKRNPRIKIAEVAGFAHYVAPMDCRAKPFDNNDVRLALKYAIDRQQIVDKVLLGHGSPGYDNPIAQGVPYAVVPKSKQRLRSGEGQVPPEEGWPERAQGRPVELGCSLCRSGGCGPAHGGLGQRSRHHHQRGPRAGRCLLGQCVDEEAVVPVLLERTADRRSHVHDGLSDGCRLERLILVQCEVRQAAGRGPLRARPGQARTHV